MWWWSGRWNWWLWWWNFEEDGDRDGEEIEEDGGGKRSRVVVMWLGQSSGHRRPGDITGDEVSDEDEVVGRLMEEERESV